MTLLPRMNKNSTTVQTSGTGVFLPQINGEKPETIGVEVDTRTNGQDIAAQTKGENAEPEINGTGAGTQTNGQDVAAQTNDENAEPATKGEDTVPQKAGEKEKAPKQTGFDIGWNAVYFALGLIFALWFNATLTDFVWSLWISSFSFGVIYLFLQLFFIGVEFKKENRATFFSQEMAAVVFVVVFVLGIYCLFQTILGVVWLREAFPIGNEDLKSYLWLVPLTLWLNRGRFIKLIKQKKSDAYAGDSFENLFRLIGALMAASVLHALGETVLYILIYSIFFFPNGWTSSGKVGYVPLKRTPTLILSAVSLIAILYFDMGWQQLLVAAMCGQLAVTLIEWAYIKGRYCFYSQEEDVPEINRIVLCALLIVTDLFFLMAGWFALFFFFQKSNGLPADMSAAVQAWCYNLLWVVLFVARLDLKGWDKKRISSAYIWISGPILLLYYLGIAVLIFLTAPKIPIDGPGSIYYERGLFSNWSPVALTALVWVCLFGPQSALFPKWAKNERNRRMFIDKSV